MKPPYINHQEGAKSRAPLSKVSSVLEIIRLPSIPKRVQPKCAACDGALEAGNDFVQAIRVCRKCIGIYSRVDSAINARAEEKTKLEKIAQYAKKFGGHK